jgi:hypothetical protein
MNATEPQETALTTAVHPMELVQRAVTSGADIAVIEKLMGLQERWEANQARKAFEAALADAKAEIPVIEKNRKVDFTTNRGRTRYQYEDFAEVARTVAPILSRHGLSYRFTADDTPPRVAVTCIISHRDGHSEKTTLSAPRDESGNKNAAQSVGSAVTYLQRYTLKAALGLAASVDDDAQTSGKLNVDILAAEAYRERWLISLADYETAGELNVEWNSESELRRNISWPPGMLAQLKSDVVKRIEELKKTDLTTQRLEAQDT